MAQLTLTFLGSFQITAAEHPLTAFATDKARALLAYLAVEGGHAHTRTALAGLLWPDQPEDRARQSLRQTILYLKQALGACEDRLTVDRDSVRFDLVAGDQLDVATFAGLSDACRRHHHRRTGRCLPCLRRYDAMAALYRGDFLAGFFVSNSDRFEEWLVLKREWLHRQAVEALEAVAAYAERRGDLEAAREATYHHVTLEPWCEEAHRTLMRLLAREGHRSAALAQYEACRRALARELGVEPTDETTALYLRIRRGDTLPTSEPPSPPIPSTALVGRDTELTDLTEILADPHSRLVTLVGPGGIGKTHLARQVAEEHRGTYRDGVVFVALGTLDSTASDAEVGTAVAEALGLAPVASLDPWSVILDALRHREMLLILDNLEHLLPNAPRPIDEDDSEGLIGRLSALLRHARDTVVLATSRERLRLSEERVYNLDGLPLPVTATVPEPERYGAIALFAQRAQQTERRFAITAATLPDILRICALVEGVPLGIELAAATLSEHVGSALACAELAAALGTTLDALTTPLHNVTPRHRSLRAAFEHSWALLTPHEQQHLAALSVFAGGFDAAAARAIAGHNPVDGTAPLDNQALANAAVRTLGTPHAEAVTWPALAGGSAGIGAPPGPSLPSIGVSVALVALVRKSLVRHDEDGRFSLHRTIAQYAVEKLTADAPRHTALRARHAAYYAAVARRCAAEMRSARATEANTTLHLEHANLRAAWAWAVERRDDALIEPLLAALGPLYRLRGPLPEGTRLVRAALVQLVDDPALPPSLGAQLFFEVARLLSTGARCDEAQQAVQKGLALAGAAASRELEAAGQLLDGQILSQQAAYEPARARLRTALVLAHETGQPLVAADALRELANITNRQCIFEEGRAHYQEALAIYRSHADIRGEAATLNNLGTLNLDAGDVATAQTDLRHALELYRQLGDLRGAAKALNNLAILAADHGDYGDALATFDEALRLLGTMGNVRGQSTILNNRGTVLWAVGQYAQAGAHYRQALRIYREIGNEQAAGETLANLSLLASSTGDPTSALTLAQQAIAASEAYDDRHNLANAWTYLARAQTTLGELDAATDSLCRARSFLGETSPAARDVEVQAGLAYIALLGGHVAQALAAIEPVLAALAHDPDVTGAEEPMRIHWISYRVLQACGDPRAEPVLLRARATLAAHAARLADPELQRSFLENNAVHRALHQGPPAALETP